MNCFDSVCDNVGKMPMLRDSCLREAKTCELVAELARREGVSESVLEMGEKRTIEVEGPARVFVVVD